MATGITRFFLVTLLGWPSIASAHTGQVKRTLMLEGAASHLEVLLEIEVSGKERLRTLWTLADLDRDGKISAAEEGVLSQDLATRGLDGLRLRVGTGTVALTGVETKIRLEPGRPVVLLLHGKAPLPRGTRRLEVETGPIGDPLVLRLLPGRPSLGSPRARKKAGGIMEIGMGQGDRVELEVAPGE